MEKHQYTHILIFSIVISLGLVSFASCLAAEFKKTQIKDIKVDGKLCYLPRSGAFEHGIVALVCLFVAQIIANLIICRYICCGEKRSSCKAKKPTIVTALLVLSWISFGIAVVIMSAATSMSRRQVYGKGWLEGECYIVKNGVYIISSVLVLVTVGSMLGASIIIIRKSQAEQGRKIHAQVG